MPTYNQDLSATSGNAPTKQVGLVDPLTGAPTQQMTNVPPQQANTLGNAQPVFNQGVQQAAQGIYGGVDQRQNSVGATPLFKLDPMHNGKPGVQKEDFEQFKK